jgi:peptidyl-prolyl cis-trans isomerase C
MRAFLLVCGALVARAQPAVIAPDAVVLTVHGREYTKAEFEEIARQQNTDPKEVVGRLTTANGFARVQALAQEAKRRKLDQDPALRLKLEMYTGALLNQALFNEVLAEVQKDETLARKYLDNRQHSSEERQLLQILIRDTASKPKAGKLSPEQALRKAEDVRARIVAGAKFAEMAQAHSDDELSNGKGGRMHMVRKPMLAPEFGAAAFQLKEGELSKPVKTVYGYHLILLEKILPPDFAVVRKSLEYEIARQRLDAMVVTGIKLNPAYFGK